MFLASKKNLRLQRSGQVGFSILEVVIAIGLTGTAAYIWAHFSMSAQRDQRALKLEQELLLLRRSLMVKVDCDLTTQDPVCATGSEADVDVLSSVSGTEVQVAIPRTGKFVDISGTGKSVKTIKLIGRCMTDTAGNASLRIYSTYKDKTKDLNIGCEASAANAETTCADLGGAWDETFKCIMPNGLRFLEPDDDGGGIERTKVVSCDIKTKGKGGDLKSCDRNSSPGTVKTCEFRSGAWHRRKKKGNGPGAWDRCDGGVYYSTN